MVNAPLIFIFACATVNSSVILKTPSFDLTVLDNFWPLWNIPFLDKMDELVVVAAHLQKVPCHSDFRPDRELRLLYWMTRANDGKGSTAEHSTFPLSGTGHQMDDYSSGLIGCQFVSGPNSRCWV